MRVYSSLVLVFVLVACGSTDSSERVGSTGELVYQEHCVLCHGESGADQVSGAKDLTISKLSRNEVVQIITNGRRLMRAYSEVLTPEEIEEVTDYVVQLRGR